MAARAAGARGQHVFAGVQLESPWWRSHGEKSQDVKCQRLKCRFTDVSPCPALLPARLACQTSAPPTTTARTSAAQHARTPGWVHNVRRSPCGQESTLDFATFAADYAVYAPLLRTPTSSMAYSLIMMWIDAEEESGAGEGALYAEADVVAEARSVYTNSPRSCCLRRPYRPAYRTSSTCKHWLWTRTAGTREDMGPRLPKAALPTCKAHGALGEQALSPVAFTHHSLESNATLHAEECEPVLCSCLSSALSSVQSTSLHSHFYTVSRIRTPQSQKGLRLPLHPDAPTPLPPELEQIHPPPMGSVKVLPPPPAARSADL
ncbi:hypothetical protein B0H14DRAFT_501421 [Mycena olivaceomarginata]|nr:hypothetical protein B0H14DRAFT_501421 [Mycena olivaceomarginata]